MDIGITEKEAPESITVGNSPSFGEKYTVLTQFFDGIAYRLQFASSSAFDNAIFFIFYKAHILCLLIIFLRLKESWIGEDLDILILFQWV
jgi:hypothetical protein